MWGLFNAKKPPPQVPEYVIVEDFVQFPIDKEYARLGESEGWLRFIGYHTIDGVLFFEYEHTRR